MVDRAAEPRPETSSEGSARWDTTMTTAAARARTTTRRITLDCDVLPISPILTRGGRDAGRFASHATEIHSLGTRTSCECGHMTAERDRVLARIEAYYDCVPRAVATTEEVGPFTLFIPEEGTGWQFYARPRLHGTHAFTTRAVHEVLARQRELGLPQAIEWVDGVTRSLLPAVRGAGFEPRLYPLLTLPADVPVEADPRARPLPPADPHLGMAVGAVSAGFQDRDDVEDDDPGRRPGSSSRVPSSSSPPMTAPACVARGRPRRAAPWPS